MERKAKSLAISTLVLFVTLQGCAKNYVKESERDQTGRFDGSWSVVIVETPNYQPYLNGHFLCGDRKGESLGLIVVTDGLAVNEEFLSDKPTFVNQEGQFLFEAPLKKNPEAFRRFNTIRGKATLILSGSLKSGTALFTYALLENGNNGCKSKVKISRI